MNCLEIVLKVDAMDDSSWVDLQKGEHKVSKPRDKSERYHIDPAKHYINWW